MAESPVALLRAHARHAPWNARGLAAHATALVDAAGGKPTNASARAAPPARASQRARCPVLRREWIARSAGRYRHRRDLRLSASPSAAVDQDSTARGPE